MLTHDDTAQARARVGSWLKLAATSLSLAATLTSANYAHAGIKNNFLRWVGICHSVGYHAQECCPCAREGQPMYGTPCTQGYFNPRPRGPIVLHESDYGMYSPSHLYWQGGDVYQGEYPADALTTPTEVVSPEEVVLPIEGTPESDPPPAGPDETSPAAEPAPEPTPAPAATPEARGPRYRSTKATRSVSATRNSRTVSSRAPRYVPGPQRQSAVQSR
ncbi:MAG: hypothetical protein AB7O68_21300 [Pirellulales bacterium]